MDLRGLGQHVLGEGDGELVELAGVQGQGVLRGLEEAVLLLLVDQALGQGAELVDVLVPGEGVRAQRVGVGDGQLVLEDGAVLEGDDGLGAEGLLVGVGGVVAAGPLRVLDGGDLVPQLDGLRTVRTLRE